MAFKADFPPVRVGASPQESRPFTRRIPVNIMAGEAPDLSFVEREDVSRGNGRLDIDRMVVLSVVVAVTTDRGWIVAMCKGSGARFWFRGHMTTHAKAVRIFVRQRRLRRLLKKDAV